MKTIKLLIAVFSVFGSIAYLGAVLQAHPLLIFFYSIAAGALTDNIFDISEKRERLEDLEAENKRLREQVYGPQKDPLMDVFRGQG